MRRKHRVNDDSFEAVKAEMADQSKALIKGSTASDVLLNSMFVALDAV